MVPVNPVGRGGGGILGWKLVTVNVIEQILVGLQGGGGGGGGVYISNLKWERKRQRVTVTVKVPGTSTIPV